MPRIILLGPPGAGKGTQGRFLARHFRVPHLATGDILRDALRHDKNGEVGQAARVISDGDMVSDAVANALVFARLEGEAAHAGWVLDGYPRTRAQAESLFAFLQARNEAVDVVVALGVGKETVLARLGGRMVCPQCAASYHRDTNPPRNRDTCDGCGSRLTTRPDDTPDGIHRRLDLYQLRTAPVADWFREKNLLYVVSGEGDEKAVLARCLEAIRGAECGDTKETLV